jgi:hypothetical protein
MPYPRRLARSSRLAYIWAMCLLCSPRTAWLSALAFVALSTQWGCAGENQAGPNAPGVGTSVAGAGGTAAAAAVLWAVGGGCKLQGCPYGSYCNKESGYCEVVRCADGCPSGTVCNEGLDRCQMAPPPSTPNDFLPQDSKLAPPGQH